MGDPGQGNEAPDSGNSSGSSQEYDERLAHFVALLLDDSEATRWKAAEALGRIGDPAAVEDLIDTLWDDDERVRIKAAWALGEIGDARAIPPLRRLYRMENEGVREIIRDALDAINRRLSAG